MKICHIPTDEELAALQDAFDDSCKAAAAKIANADVLLLCTGAGFSADSGLAVYKDVAEVEAYASRGLSYHDICDPHWLRMEPELFWGFWGQCFNDYRETSPHRGYEIIERWVQRRFRNSATAKTLREKHEKVLAQQRNAISSKDEAYDVCDCAGAFFAFTSNVDAHHFDWFKACEIHECHGNVELFQCATPHDTQCEKIWRAPLELSFAVDKQTMLAPCAGSRVVDASRETSTTAGSSSSSEETGADSAETATYASVADERTAEEEERSPKKKPCIGQVGGGGRPHLLRHMPNATEHFDKTNLADAFAANHPTCPSCKGKARPAILMFGDGDWLSMDSQQRQFDEWKFIVKNQCAAREAKTEPLNVVVLEIGAGDRVPTVRREAEAATMMFQMAGGQTTFIRINPDIPFGDMARLSPGGEWEENVISILGRGLSVLEKIDAAMPAAML